MRYVVSDRYPFKFYQALDQTQGFNLVARLEISIRNIWQRDSQVADQKEKIRFLFNKIAKAMMSRMDIEYNWRELMIISIPQKQLPEMFCKNGALKNFAIFTGKHQCWSLFLIKLQAFMPATLLKRDSITIVFLRILRNF